MKEVMRCLWVVLNGQLQWSACVLDYTVYLVERTFNIMVTLTFLSLLS